MPGTLSKEEYTEMVKNRRLLRDLAAVSAIGIPTAMILRLAAQLPKESKARKDSRKIRKYVQARNPVISVDTFDPDADIEEKTSSENVAVSAGKAALKPLDMLYDKVTRSDEHNTHLAMLLAAGLLSGTAGWKVGDLLADRVDRKRITDRQKRLHRELNRMVSEEYRRTRGLDKGKKEEKEAAETQPRRSLSKGVTSLYAAWALAALALSAAYTKKLMDKSDPARTELKRLREYARHRASVGKTPPQLIVADEEEPGTQRTVTRQKPVSSMEMID